jgi:hypothetical protein
MDIIRVYVEPTIQMDQDRRSEIELESKGFH